MTPNGATPLCNPNITIIGRKPPINNAGAQLAFVLKKVKKSARYPPKILPIGPSTENAKYPLLRMSTLEQKQAQLILESNDLKNVLHKIELKPQE